MKRFTQPSQRRKLPVKATLAGMPIRSEYVLNRLRNTRWEERETILDLIALERYILEGPQGMSAAMARDALIRHYPDETYAIESEYLPPDELAALQKNRTEIQRKAKHEKAVKEAKSLRAEEVAKKEWLTLGGKP